MIKYIWISVCFIVFVSCKETKTVSVKNEFNDIKSSEVLDINISSGKIFRVEKFPSNYITPRNIDVWLPHNYTSNKKYSVLYMHDGQMLFDSLKTWNKQEWMVDEVSSKLMDDNLTNDFIVVAIWNISEIRWQDYFPQKALDYIPEQVKDSIIQKAKLDNFNLNLNADNYLKFITSELMPYVNSNYSVFATKEKTFIAGSSMGGLISMYALCEYPEYFSGAACISTHWPGVVPSQTNVFANAIFKYMKDKLPDSKTHKLYFDFGTETLDQYYPQYEETVNAIFHEKGYNDTNFRNLKFEGDNHSEAAWQKRLDIPLTFLLGK